MLFSILCFYVVIRIVKSGFDCNITLESHVNHGNIDEVFCFNDCISCNIVCNGYESCRGLFIISVAKYTSIICNGNKACDDAYVSIGNVDIIGDPSDVGLQYNEMELGSFHIDCIEKDSCRDMSIWINGSFSNGAIVATGHDGNPLNDAFVSIDIHESTYILNIFIYMLVWNLD